MPMLLGFRNTACGNQVKLAMVLCQPSTAVPLYLGLGQNYVGCCPISSQAEGQWQPFKEKLSDKLLFPNPCRHCGSACD